MDIPIYDRGRQIGRLTAEKRGAFTVFTGDMEDVGRVLRLKVFGDGEWYLGIPEPEEGRLRLCRRVGEREMKSFPSAPEYCAEEERPETAAPTEERRPVRHVIWHGGRPYFF